ncbi:MAG: hypothetical protein ABJA78_18515 [Ferruginibacter sp.]
MPGKLKSKNIFINLQTDNPQATNLKNMKPILLLISLIPVFSFSQVNYRLYKEGDRFKYRLTSEVYRNDKFTGKTVSISEHTIVKDSGFLSEEVKWLHKTSYTSKDTINVDSIAQKIRPYKISLSSKGKVLLPGLIVPEMVGDITDLNTFYVAVAPALNAQKLSSENPIFINDKLKQGNFADSIEVLYGTDCLEVTQKLISTNKKYTAIETSFAPPSSLCLTPLLDSIAKKSFSHFNNIEFIRKSEGGKVNLFWGVETFTITSKVSKVNGQIIEASMSNFLTLKMRYNASPDLKTYAIEMPVTIKRILTLELLK